MPHVEGESCQDMEDCRLIDRHVRTLLGREAVEIARHFHGVFSPETVSECVEDSYASPHPGAVHGTGMRADRKPYERRRRPSSPARGSTSAPPRRREGVFTTDYP
ncbi:MAG TPA: hypothetical protein VFG87_26675 [Amycolatopsis sp.]|nr:hypothetical protein [Amycolatopsis sp.]